MAAGVYLLSASIPGSRGGASVGPDGPDLLWITRTNQGWEIGRLSPAGVVTVMAQLPETSVAGYLGAPALGPDGAVWYVDQPADAIVRLNPDGSLSRFPLPGTWPIENQQMSLVSGSDGNLWLEAGNNGRLARITTSGVVTLFPAPTGGLIALVAGRNGDVWFGSGPGNGEISRITPAGGVQRFPLPKDSAGEPVQVTGIAAGRDGNTWFTFAERGVGVSSGVGRIMPSGSISEMPVTAGLTPSGLHGLGVAADGSLWATEGQCELAHLSPTGTLLALVPRSQFSRLLAAPDGSIWVVQFA